MNHGYKNERNQEIVDLFISGKKYREIGSKFGISRQRVQQILIKNILAQKVKTINLERKKEHRKSLVMEVKCKVCGSTFEIYKSMRHPNRTCSTECRLKNKLTPEEARERRLLYWRNRQKTPEGKLYQANATKKWYQKMKKLHPDKYRERLIRQRIDYYERKRKMKLLDDRKI